MSQLKGPSAAVPAVLLEISSPDKRDRLPESQQFFWKFHVPTKGTVSSSPSSSFGNFMSRQKGPSAAVPAVLLEISCPYKRDCQRQSQQFYWKFHVSSKGTVSGSPSSSFGNFMSRQKALSAAVPAILSEISFNNLTDFVLLFGQRPQRADVL